MTSNAPRTSVVELLADRDLPCPDCAASLRGINSPECPACRRSLTLDDLAPSETFSSIFRKLGAVGWVAIAAAVFPALGGFILLGSLEVVGPWLKSHELAGIALYIAAFAILAGFALLPTYAQAVLGGWAFGFWAGFPAALLGFFTASLIGYEVGRRSSGDRVVRILDQHPKWKLVRDALVGGAHGTGFLRSLLIVSLVRLPPNSPFALTNILLSSVRVPRVPYALGTLVGMAPRTALAVYLASEIKGAISKDAIPKPWWAWVATFGTTVLVFGLLYAVASRAIARVVAPEPRPSQPPPEAS